MSSSRGSSQPRDRILVSCIAGRVFTSESPGKPSRMLLLLLSRFSRVKLCVTLWTAAHQAPLSMGFSSQEYWSGLPFPYPRNLPNPGIEPRSLTLQADSLPSEPPGKPKNTRVCNLSLLQRIILIQEWNWGFLHCRWILYQVSYQGSPGDASNKTKLLSMVYVV